MPMLRRRRKQSAAEDLSAEEEDIRANQRKNNEPINLLNKTTAMTVGHGC